jgi:hypothetical protein
MPTPTLKTITYNEGGFFYFSDGMLDTKGDLHLLSIESNYLKYRYTLNGKQYEQILDYYPSGPPGYSYYWVGALVGMGNTRKGIYIEGGATFPIIQIKELDLSTHSTKLILETDVEEPWIGNPSVPVYPKFYFYDNGTYSFVLMNYEHERTWVYWNATHVLQKAVQNTDPEEVIGTYLLTQWRHQVWAIQGNFSYENGSYRYSLWLSPFDAPGIKIKRNEISLPGSAGGQYFQIIPQRANIENANITLISGPGLSVASWSETGVEYIGNGLVLDDIMPRAGAGISPLFYVASPTESGSGTGTEAAPQPQLAFLLFEDLGPVKDRYARLTFYFFNQTEGQWHSGVQLLDKMVSHVDSGNSNLIPAVVTDTDGNTSVGVLYSGVTTINGREISVLRMWLLDSALLHPLFEEGLYRDYRDPQAHSQVFLVGGILLAGAGLTMFLYGKIKTKKRKKKAHKTFLDAAEGTETEEFILP